MSRGEKTGGGSGNGAESGGGGHAVSGAVIAGGLEVPPMIRRAIERHRRDL
jgi:hypothetical protein